MSVQCPRCHGAVRPKLSKIALAVGGTTIVAPLAAAFGLKAGLIALATAAWQGNRDAASLLRLKMQLMRASQQLGSFFVCSKCGEDVSVSDVFQQL